MSFGPTNGELMAWAAIAQARRRRLIAAITTIIGWLAGVALAVAAARWAWLSFAG